MTEQRIFQVALLVSILTHSIVFFGIPDIPFLPSKKSTQDIKITYYKIEEKPIKKKEAIIEKLPEIKKEELLKTPEVVAKKPKTNKIFKRSSQALNKIKEEKFEEVVEKEKDSVIKATYINYYRAVRERIKLIADSTYPRYRTLREGEVYLSFVVAASGELLEVKVIDEKSVNDAGLRNIALNNVRDSSPFPPFPTGMNHFQITFNVIIEFER